MKSSKIFALLIILALAGCRQKPEPAAISSDTAPSADAGVATAKSVPPPVYIAAQAENSVQTQVTGVADPFLTSQLRIFVKDKGRLPQSFTEFAAARLDSVPPAPAGSKWVIDSATMEVKAGKK